MKVECFTLFTIPITNEIKCCARCTSNSIQRSVRHHQMLRIFCLLGLCNHAHRHIVRLELTSIVFLFARIYFWTNYRLWNQSLFHAIKFQIFSMETEWKRRQNANFNVQIVKIADLLQSSFQFGKWTESKH